MSSANSGESSGQHSGNYTAPHSLACESCCCIAYDFDLCPGIKKTKGASRSADTIDFTRASSSLHRSPARRTIVHIRERTDFVLVICKGWAARSIKASNGRQQILSILLPGDLISTASLFDSSPNCHVEAITETTYRQFRRLDLKDLLFGSRSLLEKLAASWVDERVQADQVAFNLGQKRAEVRIAWLILNLAKRLAMRGMNENGIIEFPLRHWHIAYATALTPRFVSKILGHFQRSGLIKLYNRTLQILDEDALAQIAGG